MAKQINGKTLSETLIHESFPPCNYLKEFVKKETGLDFDADLFTNAFHPSHEFSELLNAAISNEGKSCGRTLLWSILVIQPHKAFQLHAHPNIEINYVLSGNLYQKYVSNYLHPDDEKNNMSESCVEQHSMLLNMPNSIHQSFTRDAGAILLCLFSGQWIFLDSHHPDLLPVTATKSSGPSH